ncbi:MAG: hypothetical protein AB7I32_19195 [Gammaproteobacteria bacterium]
MTPRASAAAWPLLVAGCGLASFAAYAWLAVRNPHVGFLADDALYLMMAEMYSPARRHAHDRAGLGDVLRMDPGDAVVRGRFVERMRNSVPSRVRCRLPRLNATVDAGGDAAAGRRRLLPQHAVLAGRDARRRSAGADRDARRSRARERPRRGAGAGRGLRLCAERYLVLLGGRRPRAVRPSCVVQTTPSCFNWASSAAPMPSTSR